MNLRLRGRLGAPASPPQVWATDHQSVQITWGWLEAETVTVRCGDQSITVEQAPGPGGVLFVGLDSDSGYRIDLVDDRSRSLVERPLSFRTLPRPPGELLYRVATISDMHLGSSRWGFFKTMTEACGVKVDGGPPPAIVAGEPPGPYRDLHPVRCAQSALDDAEAWGARLVVAKGDNVQHENAECHDLFGSLVDSAPELPMMAIPGNHDLDEAGRYIPDHVGRRKLPICRDVAHLDLPGVRVVVADTSIPGRGKGTVERVGPGILDTVADADRPVLLFTHQQFQPGKVARHWPIGITAPESTDFLDRLDGLGTPVVISSGHTHRNRVRRHGSVLLTEVGSTRDWPCVWAGYNIFEGGLEQTVHRVSEQTAMAWAEYSRQAVGGLWSTWSPGTSSDRNVGLSWPNPRIGWIPT
ncbi:MAG: metallophosphoesterase [Acidimicrobiia bacterium]|nr:metallophosphoesterase [Acidimicrobiia bacterium]